MKHFLLTTLAFSCCLMLNAQGNWYQLKDFPGEARYASTGFEVNGKGYLVAGYNPSTLTKNDTWEYEPLTDQWTQKTDFPGGKRWYACGFTIGGKAYYGTGTLTSDWWEYDPSTDTWTQKNDFPFVPRVYAVGFSLGNKGYVGLGAQSGQNNTTYKDFWEYDSTTDSWTQLPDFPGGARNFAVAFVIGNKAYVGTGEYPTYTYHNDLWEFDPSINQWSAKAAFPGLPRSMAVSFAVGGLGYVGMGVTIPVSTFYFPTDMWRYNPNTDQWQQVFGVPRPKLTGVISFTIGNAAYVATGHPYGSDVWKFSDEKINTEINENAAENKIEIFPNPASGWLTITGTIKDDTIEIYNYTGQLIYKIDADSEASVIDLAAYSPGIYNLKYITSSYNYSRKFVVAD